MNPKNYAQVLYEVLENKTEEQQDKILARFKALLARNKEAYLAPAIEKELNKIQQQKEQERTTYIASASELTEIQKKKLGTILAEPQEFSVNPSLLGGIAIRHRDKLYNSTLRKRVEALKSLL